jgi:hypothetical protein
MPNDAEPSERSRPGNDLRRWIGATILLAFLSPMTISLGGCTVLGLIDSDVAGAARTSLPGTTVSH